MLVFAKRFSSITLYVSTDFEVSLRATFLGRLKGGSWIEAAIDIDAPICGHRDTANDVVIALVGSGNSSRQGLYVT